MGRLHLRKNNIGKAIIRFLIGLLILAILVWLLYEFVLTGEFNASPRMDNVLTLEGTRTPQTTTTININLMEKKCIWKQAEKFI